MPTIILSLLAILAFGGPASGQSYERGVPFGTINVAPDQNAYARFESLIGTNNFVRLATYPPAHAGRKLASPVGRLDIELGERQTDFCTASLISEDLVLTNHHCIPRYDRRRILGARLLMNYYDEATSRDAESFSVSVTPVETSVDLDYSILRVAGRPGRRYGYFRLPVADPRPNEPLILFHHPLGQPKTLSARDCRAASDPIDVDGQIVHYCDTLGGSSGSVLLDVNGNRLIGLHFAGAYNFNLARPLTTIRRQSRILAQLFPDQSPPPLPDPTVAPVPQPGPVPRPGSTWTDPVSGIEFVWVPGGSFEMGCGSWSGECYSGERPLHRRTVRGFWLGKYEVTQGQWRRVMGNNPSHFSKGDTYPVERVSWNDAQEFIRRLNSRGNGTFRLPSEAEWEYACRSGGRPELYCGGGSVNSVAWYAENSGSSTQAVGRKAANGLGLYDMSGNVWEWVEDCWNGSYSGAPSDGRAWTTGDCSPRVLRGGSWFDVPGDVRSANRYRFSADDRSDDVGFRLARTFPP